MYDHQRYFHLLIIFILFSKSIVFTLTSPVPYDQRQDGDLNVQIDVEDVQVVALVDKEFLDDYTEYNYVYDYADLTIKPITKPTTAFSSSSTVKPWTTWPTKPALNSSSSLPPNLETAESTSNLSSEATTTLSLPTLSSDAEMKNNSTHINDANVTLTTPKAETITQSERNEASLSNKSRIDVKGLDRGCRRGTYPDSTGRCRKIPRRRTSFFPKLTQRLAPERTHEASEGARIESWMAPRS